MYSAGKNQIDEVTRRQLLDNYLRNQQTQSTPNAFNISSLSSGNTQFHPSQFQTPSVVSSVHNDDRSETFSDISRRSVMTSFTTQQVSQINNNLIQVNEQRPQTTMNNTDNMSIVPVDDLPENISIEDFSNLVKKWIEIDNWIKKSQELAKQKRKQKDKLSEVITHYMTRYNIEDLNTSEGKIRCKVRMVKSGVNQKVVKEKIAEFLKDNEETCNTLITKIFNEREKVEKVSLRRIKIT
jgi:hypothetical protein